MGIPNGQGYMIIRAIYSANHDARRIATLTPNMWSSYLSAMPWVQNDGIWLGKADIAATTYCMVHP